MMHSDPRFDPDVDAVLEGAKVIQPLPAAVRTRALARARAGMAAKYGAAPPIRAPRRRSVVIALAASFAIAVVAATAVAALGIQAARRSVPTPPSGSHMAAPPPARTPPPPNVAAAPTIGLPTVDREILAAPKTQRPLHTTAQESYAAELELLTRAQVAYAGRDFANALALVAEHGRRFPSGRLTEEREALRVRSLTGAGRTDDAQRAAAGFAERFPRSVLLSRSGRARH